MSKQGAIVVVEDDLDDQEILQGVIGELSIPNELKFFTNCIDAFTFLKTTEQQPFLILCDINLPITTGIEFKAQIDSDPELRKKSIPFVFLSTAADKDTVNEAYLQLTVQGFFKKSYNIAEYKNIIRAIMDYWILCKHPNSI